MTNTTIFTKIINGEIPCEKLHEDEICIAFNDIAPQAPIHYLVIPKKPIINLLSCQDEDRDLLGHLLLVGKGIAIKKGIKDLRTIINNGEEAGQTVFHLHIHFLGGRSMQWPPG